MNFPESFIEIFYKYNVVYYNNFITRYTVALKVLCALSKLARDLWSKKTHFNRPPSNFKNWSPLLDPYSLKIWMNFLVSFQFYSRSKFDISWSSYTALMGGSNSFRSLITLYMSKRKRTIPSILQPHIPLTLLYDVLVFYQKL